MKGNKFLYVGLAVFGSFIVGFYAGARIWSGLTRADIAFNDIRPLREQIEAVSEAMAAVTLHLERAVKNAPRLLDEGEASWYGPGFEGRKTANLETYDPDGYTVAHRTIRLGSLVIVEDMDTGKQAVARVTDRGPYGIPGRVVDLSFGLARYFGIEKKGTMKVRVWGVPRLNSPDDED
jgi:rare lipoprotein A